MVLEALADLATNPTPLVLKGLDVPTPSTGEILIKVAACGVCRTELDEIEGRSPPPRLPVIPGHQVVGRVEAPGPDVSRFHAGDRVGVAWVFSTCGRCAYCRSDRENLCPGFVATGRDADGGYAEFMTVREDYVFTVPEELSDVQTAPLLCAGAIGFRALSLTGIRDGESLGLAGFGASAHLVLRMARRLYPASRVFAFARSASEREFARDLGAVWAGGFGERSPEPLAAIIDTTPAWTPVRTSLENLAPGGRLVINAISKDDRDRSALESIDYATHLWMEKEIKTVANITRRDVREFLALAAQLAIRPDVREFRLEDANAALMETKRGDIRGAKVLLVD